MKGGDVAQPSKHVLFVLEIEVGDGKGTAAATGGEVRACGGLIANWTVFLRNGSTDSEVFRQVSRYVWSLLTLPHPDVRPYHVSETVSRGREMSR